MAKVHFRTNVLLKSIIGKDLITDDNVAVLELVKNSFDAGSRSVEIDFRNIKKNDDSRVKTRPTAKSSKLIISDRGSGMSESDLVNKWLNIAYSEKKIKREEYGRILAGNKGVGRFSCDRLGKYLTIYTKRKDSKIVKLYIDWQRFEKDEEIDLNIQDIDLDMITISESDFKESTGIKSFKSGTILEISGLRSLWTHEKILSLKRQLERLINPNQSFKSSTFDIWLIAKDYLANDEEFEEHKKINGEVRNRIFDSLNFKTTSIKAIIDDTGEIITTILQDRGREIFKLTEKNKFTLLKSINVFIYYLNPYSKAYFTRQTGIRSVDFGSIFLFINGFRIPPYGDDGDDWLNMENRKAQGQRRYLGAREVVGRIEIKDENEKFKIISSRTGVLANPQFLQLTKSTSPFGYYYKTFRRLERFVVEGIKWDSINEGDKNIEKKVLNDPNWNESKENYIDDSLTRNKRIISVINNIIDAKKHEIIDLEINEDFVEELIADQADKIKLELAEIAERINDKDLTPDELAVFLSTIASSRDELKTLSNTIAPYGVGAESIDSIDKTLEDKYLELQKEKQKLENRLRKEEELRKEAEQVALKAEDEKKQAEFALEVERKKNTYLLATRRTISSDADGLIHNIKLNTTNILSYVNLVTSQIKSGKYDNDKLLEYLGGIAIEAEKCLTISKIITRADIQDEVSNKPINIPQYISQYCEHYNDIFDRKISCLIESSVDNYLILTNILDLSLVFDNLFSNSQKWDASKIFIKIDELKQGQLSIIVNDDGKGLSDKYTSKPEQIFELGVNELPPKSLGYGGSGIGLNTIKRILNKNFKGDIEFIGNGYKYKGATFKLTFKTKYPNAKLPSS